MKRLKHKRIKRFGWLVLLGMIVMLGFNACFSRYIYTDREIEQHYANKQLKPEFSYTDTDGKKIFHAVSGDSSKPLLVLIHGTPGAWYGYMNMIDDSVLSSHFRILAMDRLGYFKSRNGKSYVKVADQVEVIEALITKFKGPHKQYYLLGRSYGAPIAAAIAARNSESIAHLYMISPAMDPTTERFFWFSPLGKWFIFRWFLPKAINTATDEKYAHIHEMKQLQAVYPQIKCSTTVMTGSKDWIVDTTNFEYCQKVLVNAPAKFIKLPNNGHLITYESPQMMREILIGNKIDE
jgi:pimeloyl-ACP methyl ester carboxylesterase